MPYIKKLVMKGFKSFAKETEVPFINGMNVIVGANGSGKSNITDAICFVLGRLSIKSMRAAKAANLIFAGTKEHKPAGEASVRLIFDNSDKKLSLEDREIIIERIVRNNGQGIYKINHENKTRQEVLELLASAGIDPYGFNIVLQGEITSFVKMHPEERRKIIEEVSGISIYELRKEKSLHELEKTGERLKEAQSVLRERISYLKNLEEERKQALKYKKYEELVSRCKVSILAKKLEEKQKEISLLRKKVEEKEKLKAEIKEKSAKTQGKIAELELNIQELNSLIQRFSGVEQEKLQSEIADIRAELAGLEVRKENAESKISEILTKRSKIEENIKSLENEISQLKKSPSQTRKFYDLEKKKQELEEIEKQRKLFYNLKERLNSIKEKIQDKEKSEEKNNNELAFILKETERIAEGLEYKEINECRNSLNILKSEHNKIEKRAEEIQEEIKGEEKNILLSETEMLNSEKIKKQVSSLDICPLCKSRITAEHLKEVYKECDEKISQAKKTIELILTKNTKRVLTGLNENLSILKNRISKAEISFVKLENIEDKKTQLKKLSDERNSLKSEILSLIKEKENIVKKFSELKNTEESYEETLLAVQEISSRTEDTDTTIEFKKREMERYKISLNQNKREEQDLKEELEAINYDTEKAEKELEKKNNKEADLEIKFRHLIDKKASLEKSIHQENSVIFELRSKIAIIDNDMNNLKVEKARLDAEKENLEIELKVYEGVEIINLSITALEQKLIESQNIILTIGSVNMKALETYDLMKKEYESVAEKVSVLENEKLEIVKIIEEIDKKKKRTFMKTLNSINELFTRNFSQLSKKGTAFLELENEEDIFSGGLNIIIKVGKGKYFDVTSLSGGEQTLAALSLIFAIQEYKPYSFYIFDEVDAALDKRNSEILVNLIKKYMKTGQYIIVTHNDAIITESSVLYGVSMQEGISKILSLEI